LARVAEAVSGAACAAALLALSLAAPAVWAGTVQVSNTRLEIARGARSVAITVRNPSDEQVVVQMNVVAWSQSSGKDVYVDSEDFVVAPPIATIAAGGEQIVRLVTRRRADPTIERTYRLYISEVPPPPKPGFRGLQVALRIGVPVFVVPSSGKAAPKITWRAERRADRIHIGAQNDGNGHVKFTVLEARASDGRSLPISPTEPAYILPGAAFLWEAPVEHGPVPPRIHVKASTDAGEITTDLPVER
jgi:fimbrial chaperone protein